MLNSAKDIQVDAVVMWVDSDDPKFQEQYEEYNPQSVKNKAQGEGKGRHRSNGELKYCLRGIYKNLPWVRNIYIVTNGQRPGFIRDNAWGDKVHLVTHSEILPEEVLPTFNSFAIESALHNIPGLSENFLRFSDDFFVISPVEKETVFGSMGYGRQYLGAYIPKCNEEGYNVLKKPYLNLLVHNREILEGKLRISCDKNYLHVPQLRAKSVCEKFCEVFSEEVDFTRRSRLRALNNVSLLFSYPHYVLDNFYRLFYKDGVFQHPDVKYKHWGECRQVLAGDKNSDWKKRFEKAFDEQVLFLNVNDNFGENPEPEDVEWLELNMEDKMSYKAPWEA